MNPLRSPFAPPLAMCGLLVALARLQDHGIAWGVGVGTIEASGYFYVALLVAAPVLLVPWLRMTGASTPARAALSALPTFLWWGTEIGVRLEQGHSAAEALWLVASPFQIWQFGLVFGFWALTELVCGFVVGPRFNARRVATGVALFVAWIVGGGLWLQPFLKGYQSVFQSDLLPIPAEFPGPLDPATVAPPAERPPNIVVILSDDHRYDFMSHEGHPFVETPSLDRIANEGVRFRRAYVTSSLCSPSRASFLTGTTPHRHGVWNNFTPWTDGNRTFFEYLKPAGYRTAFIGKWHMPGNLPELRGVDHFVTFTAMAGQGVYEWCPLVVNGEEEPSRTRYIATELTDRALEWVGDESEQREQPFALYLSHKSVHAMFTPDEPDRDRYAGAPEWQPEGSQPWIHTNRAQYVHMTVEPLQPAVETYAETIVSLDREIGRLLDELDRRGLAENTIVIYTSDNGYFWGERGLTDKRWPYEESIRIPFLVRWPGHAVPGETVDRVVANTDLAPTLLALAGVETPEHMQGRNFLPLLSNETAPWREAFHYAYYFEPPYPTPTADALVTERYKWIDYAELPDELYDLRNDPNEKADLSNDPKFADVKKRLIEKLRAARRLTMTPPSG